MIKFFYDTDSELRFDIAKELEIENDVIRMPYSVDGIEYLADLGENFNAKDFFNKLRSGILSSTAALNPEEYINYFMPYAEKGVEVFYVSFGTAFSGTFRNLDIAIREIREKYPDFKFTRYDTEAISMAAGLIVIQAAKLLKSGLNVKEVCDELDKIKDKINAVFVVDDLKHLKRGGRLSSAEAFFGGILQIKPIIKLSSEGKLKPAAKVTGRNKAFSVMVKEIIETFDASIGLPLVIMNGDCLDEAKRLEQQIKTARPEIEIWQYDVGPVIGTHCGPNTIGFCYPSVNSRPVLK
ncbi:MAG TPA: DegV family protein [Clostridiales bacterium]|nr:DegV family protein [Clostridiales bacterium]